MSITSTPTTPTSAKEGADMNELDILYTPATIGRLRLKNRFIQSPMHRSSQASSEKSPTS